MPDSSFGMVHFIITASHSTNIISLFRLVYDFVYVLFDFVYTIVTHCRL